MPATDFSLDRGLPASPEAERSILGAILLDNNLQNEALSTLKSDHFFLDAHRRIYQRIADLSENNRPIDIVTLTEELLRHKELEAVGGAGYLASLTDGVPRRSSVEHYVRIVRDKAMLRNLIHAANGVISQALEQASSAAEVIDSAESAAQAAALLFNGRLPAPANALPELPADPQLRCFATWFQQQMPRSPLRRFMRSSNVSSMGPAALPSATTKIRL